MAASVLTPSFLGKPVEMCIVTADWKRTLIGLCALGIGPWRIYNCNPSNTTNQTYRGQSSPYDLVFCYAELTPDFIYEVIQPVPGSGPTIFKDHLEKKGEGLHHVAYDCNGVPMEERVRMFRKRGFEVVQGGVWLGGGEFQFWENEAAGTYFETIDIKEGFEWPEPDEVFPAETCKSDENVNG